jgi:hypothetical protein
MMTKARSRTLCACVLFFGCVHAFAGPSVYHVFGPRAGFTFVAAPAADFNTMLQEFYPDAGRDYVPIMSQFGVNLEQRIQLGFTDSHFVFQEVILVTGLDQNILIPSFSGLIGFRSKFGLEFGLGPSFNIKASDSGIEVAMTVVYAIGWTISFSGVYVPINLVVLPTPADGLPRIGIITGFNFFIGDDPYK